MEILEIIAIVSQVLAIMETAIQVFGPVIQKIGQALGLIDEDEKCEDLGARALNAEDDGIRPENFGSFEEYLKEIKKYSPETDKPLDERVKKGAELILGIITEKYPGLEPEVFAVLKDLPEIATEIWGLEFGNLLKTGELDPAAVSDYFLKRPMSDSNRCKVNDSLVEIEKKINPEISNVDALKKVAKVRN